MTDEAIGMSVADLVADDDPRTLDEVLRDITAVLGEIEDADDDHSLCLEGEYLCDRCYDQESRYIATSYFSTRVADSIVRQWSIAAFVAFRAEVLDADRAPRTDPGDWFERQGFDEVDQAHIWMECGDDCPVCRGEHRYRQRAYRSQPPKPRGWTRFVDFVGDAEIRDADGTVLVPIDARPVEEHLADFGLSHDEIGHAIGTCNRDCGLCLHWKASQASS